MAVPGVKLANSPPRPSTSVRQRWKRWLDAPPLREREFKRFVVLALVYRVGIMLTTLASLSEVSPAISRRSDLIAGVTVAVIIANLAMMAPALRRGSEWFADARWLRTIDLGAAVGLNLWSAAVITAGTLFVPYHDFLWPYVFCVVALWTGVRGIRMGLVLVAASVPLQLLMGLVNGVALGEIEWGQFWAREGWVILGFIVSAFFVSIARDARDHAAGEANRAGREAERARALRELHDNSLQTLDGIALRAEVSGADPAATLQLVAAEARRQAAQVRALLQQGYDDQGGIYAQLEALIAEVQGRATVVPHWVPVGPEPALADHTKTALIGAVGEALRNAERHAGAGHVTIFLESAETGLQVTVRDDGQGFDESTVRADAFGVRQSIRQRLAEVGGSASLETSPGAGTTWELRVPLAADVAHGETLLEKG